LGGVFDYSSHIDVHRLSLADEPACRVGDAINIRIIHRFECPHSYFFSRAAQAGMYGSYYKVQLRKQFIIKIYRAIGKDINFGSGKDGDTFKFIVKFTDLFDLVS
jgi:hypothetical protein